MRSRSHQIVGWLFPVVRRWKRLSTQSRFRFTGLLRTTILHTTGTGLRTKQCMQLRVAKRSIVLAVHIGCHSDDAGAGRRNPSTHFPMRCLRSAIKCYCRTQSIECNTRLSTRLGLIMDRLQFLDGMDVEKKL